MKKYLAVAATFAIFSPLANAQASDSGWSDVHGTIGVRAWRVDWTSWFGQDIYKHADLETTITPVASVRYKDFLVSGSYMLGRDFQFPFAGYPQTERKEYDVNLGYFLLPGLAATIGYKYVKYDVADNVYHWNAKGLTAGLSGSAPLAPWVSLYGNAAYGKPKVTGVRDFNDARGKYLLTELGVAFPLRSVNESMTGFVVTAGYRYQRIGAVRNTGPVSPTGEMFEYAQGPVIGISFSL